MKSVVFYRIVLIIIIIISSNASTQSNKNLLLFDEYDASVDLKKENIFMVHTSNERQPGLASRCTIESVARFNPTRIIYIFSPGFDSEAIASFQMDNIKLVRYNFDEIYSKIPVFLDWYKSDVWNNKHRYVNLADTLRVALLYLYGGIYMDMDITLTRSLDDLPDSFIGIEEYYEVSNNLKIRMLINAIMKFNKPKNEFLRIYINSIVNIRNIVSTYGIYGPKLITKVFMENEDLSRNVYHIHTLASKHFYYIPWQRVELLFTDHLVLNNLMDYLESNQTLPCATSLELDEREQFDCSVYGIHLWHSLIKSQLQFLHTDFEQRFIGRLFRFACPKTYSSLPKVQKLQNSRELVDLRINSPVIGSQYLTGSSITVSIAINLLGTDALYYHDYKIQNILNHSPKVCFQLNFQPLKCESLESREIRIQNLPPGHHNLIAELCITVDSAFCAVNQYLDAFDSQQCNKGLAGVRLGRRAISSFTVGKHDL